jgi:hypothetical protein
MRPTPTLTLLRDALPRTRPTRISEVVSRLKALAAALPAGDGIGAFTTLYLAVTQAVQRTVGSETFEDPAFIRRLDVVLANVYFDVLDALAAGHGAPPAWVPLLEARRRPGVLPLQFALAGMNAHINRDLPLALVATCEERRIDLRRRSPQHRDFRRIDTVLARTEERVKARFLTGELGEVDAALGRVDDVVAIWKLERARAAAWSNAETLWALRGQPQLRDRFLQTLDRLVGLAGRGLLRPVAA